MSKKKKNTQNSNFKEEKLDYTSLLNEYEKTIRELEDVKLRFDSLFEMTNDAIIIMDLNTSQYLMANKKAAELLGFSLSNVSKYKAQDFLIKNELADSKVKLKELLEGNILPIYERTFTRLDGTSFIGEVNLSLIEDKITGKRFIQSIIRDVSARKIAEDTLKRDRTVYHNIAQIAIEAKDIQDFCNSVLSQMLHYLDFEFGSLRVYDKEKQQLIPISIIGLAQKLIPELKPMSLDDTKYIISESISKRKPLFAPDVSKVPELIKFKDRIKKFNMNSLISWPILDSKNEILGSIQLSSSKIKEIPESDKIFFESIAHLLATALERLQTQEALSLVFSERKELEKIINLSPAVVILWKNQQGWPLEFVSDNIKQFGYSPEDFISGKIKYSDIIHPDFSANNILIGDTINENNFPYEFPIEYKILTKDGTSKWVIEYSTPRRNEKGKITHFYGIVLDITDRRLNEELLQRDRSAFQIIAEAAAISFNITQLCQNILSGLIKIFEFDVGSIRLYNPSYKSLDLVANVGIKELVDKPKNRIHISNLDFINALVARTKEPVFAPDFMNFNIAEQYKENMRKINIKSMITWPILDAQGNLIAVLQLVSKSIKKLLEEDKFVFETLAKAFAITLERMNAEELQRESEEKFRALAEQSLTGFLIFKADGEILFVNQHLIHLTGYEVDEVINSGFPKLLDVVKAKNKEVLQKFVINTQQGKTTNSITSELVIHKKNDEQLWLSITLTPITIRNEKVFTALLIDITKEKLAQLELQNEREILEIISEATAKSITIQELSNYVLFGIIKVLNFDVGSIRMFDKENQFLIVSAEYGFTNNDEEQNMLKPISVNDKNSLIAELARRKTAIFTTDVKNDKFLRKYEIVRKLDIISYISVPIISSTGKYYGIMQLGAKVKNKFSMEIKKLFDSTIDILTTAIEKLEVLEELRKSEERFKHTIDTMDDGITIIENNQVVYVNKRACEIFGCPEEELLNISKLDFITPESYDNYLLDIEEIISSQKSVAEFEYWIVRKDGSRRFVKNKHYFEFEDGKPKDLIISTTDITETKLAQEAIIRLNEELEDRVRLRTAQLEQVNKELEAFSYSVSHDLRTPLRSIDGFSLALLEDYSNSLDNTAKDYLSRVREATKRMSNLIDDLLSLSRLTRKELVKETVNLSELTEKIMQDFKDSDKDRKVKTKVMKNLVANADLTLIRTVLENLIGNAWKFTSRKSIASIEFGMKVIDKAEVFYIKDNGVGFNTAYSDKLFAAFQRLHSDADLEGTGIGLTIVQRIISRHGGEIWAESKINDGSTFYFTLPK
ncbi:MAG: PAS domain S-box protein [Asgard group archaeon]|nr:PAS domain S-box protein [Asgard group archaeon]